MSLDFQSFKKISVVGAGLAGSECALQLANCGYAVDLYEMRDSEMTPAHKTNFFSELVCSNSFGSQSEGSAPQQLKWEAERLNCEILAAAKSTNLPAGQALAVDRSLFAKKITEKILQHPNITIIKKAVKSLQEVPRPTVFATGPLTQDGLAGSMQDYFGKDFLYFYDAIAPIVDADSINTSIAWKQDRYNKGSADYLNCPFDKEQYFNFINAVKAARKIEPKQFETTKYFEGCMPIEEMIERGPHTLRFGPMKPVGLMAPNTEREPYAVVQLRQDNQEGTAYNMVGFQTRMAFPEQQRVFRMIPGLENAEFLKLGTLHRNLFINSPELLNKDLSCKKDPWLFFAGQMVGVEGYFESTCMGLLVAKFIDHKIKTKKIYPDDSIFPPRSTALGSLLAAITDANQKRVLQPTNINFGLFPALNSSIADKAQKKLEQIRQAQEAMLSWVNFSQK